MTEQFPDDYLYWCVYDAYQDATTPVTIKVERENADFNIVNDAEKRMIQIEDAEVLEPTTFTAEELSLIQSLYCEGYYDDGDGYANEYIKDTSGIDLLTNLEYLHLKGHNIASIDLSKNKKLEIVDLPSNNISSLKLPEGRRLWGLKLNGNWIQTLDLSANLGVEVLFLDSNPFNTFVDLTHNFSLRNLYSGDVPVFFGNKAYVDPDDELVKVNLSNLLDYNISFVELLESSFYELDEDNSYVISYLDFGETTPQYIEMLTDEGNVVKILIDFSEVNPTEEVPAIPDTSEITDNSGTDVPATPDTGLFTKEDEGMKAVNLAAMIVFVVAATCGAAFIFNRAKKSISVRKFSSK